MNRDLNQIKVVLKEHVGTRVELKTNRGRKKILTHEGVIANTYPSLFTVDVDSPTQRTMSFNYADVLTKTVIITFSENKENILS